MKQPFPDGWAKGSGPHDAVSHSRRERGAQSSPAPIEDLTDGTTTVLIGDVRERLSELEDESVHCVVTSPPYWGLRDYGTGSWVGGNPDCDHTGPPKASERSGLKNDGRPLDRVGQNDYERAATVPFRDVCGKCGATRVDRQLGLEPTPDEYVENIVGVFREVRRVLRADGTCWMNLGDCYASSMTSDRHFCQPTGPDGRPATTAPPQMGAMRTAVSGLKPKDLVGIPWAVAKALQAPYYTGRIKDERDRIWLAALVDTEGCIHIHKRNAGAKSHTHTLADGTTTEYQRKTDTYGVMVSIDNTSEALIDRFHALVGQGSRYTHEKGVGKSNRKQTLYRITLTGQQSRELLRELYPHLVAKQREARIAYHAPSSGDSAEAAWHAIKALHNGLETTVDYPAPPTLFEPGWYLRCDVIWGKPNPMPESVSDRPTKAHEYLFLLTRSPRYYFDADAIREPYRYGDDGRIAYTGQAEPNERRGVSATGPDGRRKTTVVGQDGSAQHRNGERWPNPSGRNKRSVWEIATEPYPEAHFATFPQALVEPCVKAGCPVDGTVLDPFAGSGTTLLVARRLGRRAIGVELSAEYAALIPKRFGSLWGQLSLLDEGAAA